MLWAAFHGSADRRLAVRVNLMLGAELAQVALGVATLLLAVPTTLGVAHQGGAMLLLVAVLLTLHAVTPAAPVASGAPGSDA